MKEAYANPGPSAAPSVNILYPESIKKSVVKIVLMIGWNKDYFTYFNLLTLLYSWRDTFISTQYLNPPTN